MDFTSLNREELKRKEKQLKRVLEELNEKDAVIIVEGKKDRAALQRIGVRGRIELVNRSSEELSRRISGEKEAILLTDFDDAGEEICRRMQESLSSYNVKADVDFRRKFHRILRVRNFETIDKQLEEFEKETKRW
jgi:5S rRNA maturation endonuclease (ribonuclease M5)